MDQPLQHSGRSEPIRWISLAWRSQMAFFPTPPPRRFQASPSSSGSIRTAAGSGDPRNAVLLASTSICLPSHRSTKQFHSHMGGHHAYRGNGIILRSGHGLMRRQTLGRVPALTMTMPGCQTVTTTITAIATSFGARTATFPTPPPWQTTRPPGGRLLQSTMVRPKRAIQ